MTNYSAVFEPDPKGGFVVRILDFPNIVTQADSIQEACEMAVDAIRTFFLGEMALGRPIPASKPISKGRTRREIHAISLPALDSAKIELYQRFQESGLRKTQLAARMKMPRSHVDRLFNLRHASRLDQIEAAFAALGRRLVISTKSAA